MVKTSDDYEKPKAIRIPTDDEWVPFGDATKAMHPEGGRSPRTAVIREFMRWYMRRPGAMLPKRPDAGPWSVLAAVEHSPPVAEPEPETVVEPEADAPADDPSAWMLTNPLPVGTTVPPTQLGLSRAVAVLPVRRARLLASDAEKQHPEWAQQARAELSHLDPRWYHHALLQAAVNAGKAEIPA